MSPAESSDEWSPGPLRDRLRKAAAQAGLPPELASLHRQVLRAYLATGGAPGAAELGRLASGLGLPPGEAMARLEAADLVHADPATGAATTAYPFSGVPTPHEVRVGGAPLLYAMCAIDALGIPLMAGRDGVINSVSPGAGDPITVEFRAGTWRWQPATAVVLLASSGAGGPSRSCSCPFIAFHATAEQAAAYLRDGPATAGRIVTQTDAVAAAEAEFGRLLTG
jgi:Alkylmercury lyase